MTETDVEEPEWDLDECHVTRALKKDPSPAACIDCGVTLDGPNRDVRRCELHRLEFDAGRARRRRAQKRLANPPSKTRTFTCRDCQNPFTTDKLGRFTRCPACVEKRDIEGRTKVCAYRECGETFLDTSPKNSMTYCCEEHRRREKMLRLGKVRGPSQFRDKEKVRWGTCLVCRGKFDQPVGAPRSTRCSGCKEKARRKECRKCGAEYRDASEKNTRRYCDACQP